jgi:hypothetical protein
LLQVLVFRALSKEGNGYVGAEIMEVAGGHEAIAAIITWAGEDDDAAGADDAELVTDGLGDGAASIFHEAGDGLAGGEGLLFEGAHLGCGD